MIKRFLNLLRMTFFSVELLIWIVLFCLYLLNINKLFVNFAKEFYDQTNGIEYLIGLLTLPGACLAFTLSKYQSILQPEKSFKKILKWERYLWLKDGVRIGLMWNILCFILTIAIWLYKNEIDNSCIGFIYFSGLLSSAFSSLSIFMASINIREVIEKNSEEQ